MCTKNISTGAGRVAVATKLVVSVGLIAIAIAAAIAYLLVKAEEAVGIAME
jgi:hypothetical protein